MSLTLKQIEAFVAVARHASFVQAAQRLNTTQPNISARIAKLEALLGGPLFVRAQGRVSLTPRGQDVLGKAQGILRDADAFLAESADAGAYEGTLSLGVTELVAHTWLRDFMVQMRNRFPSVLVELTVDLSAEISASLEAGALDLALQSAPFAKDLSGKVALGSYPYAWVISPQVSQGETLGVQDLAHLPILTHARGTRPYAQLAEFISRDRTLTARLAPSSNIAACLQMTLDGLGVTCLPRAMVEEDLLAGRLLELEHGWHPDPLDFFARFDAAFARRFVVEAAGIAQDVAINWRT